MEHQEQSSAGLLDTPLNWLCQLLDSLPASEKLALFRTSKWLARQVVCHSGHVSIHLRSAKKNICSRKAVVVKLLEGCQELSIEADDQGMRMLPMSASVNASIVSLSLKWPEWYHRRHKPSVGSFFKSLTSFEWNAFCNVKELRVVDYVGPSKYGLPFQGEFCELARILKSNGSLPHLKSLHFFAMHVTDVYVTEVAACFAWALGSQLEQLHTNVTALVSKLSMFKKLKSITVDHVDLRGEPVDELCGHPHLEHVRIGSNCYIYGWPFRLPMHRAWRTLVVANGFPSVLHRLPWKGLRELRIVGQLHDSRPDLPLDPVLFDGEHCLHGLHAMLTDHPVPVVVEPVAGKFSLHGLSDGQLLFVRMLRQACELQIHSSMCDCQQLQHLWHGLPACVHTVSFHDIYDFSHWPHLWHGLPTSIRSVGLYQCQISLHDLRALVQSAPSHLKTMRVACMFVKLHGLQGCAPAHLRVCA